MTRIYHSKKGPITIRPVRVEDASSILIHLKTVDQETRFLARAPGEMTLTLEEEENFIRGIIEDETTHFLVAEAEGRIIATCSIGLVMKRRRFRHRASLGIGLQEAFWGLGIGSCLLEACEKWAKKTGVEQMELEVVVDNDRGLGLYKKMGFEVFGTKKKALKYDDGTYADEYFMIKFLNE